MVQRLSSGPSRQSDSTCSTIWTLLSAASVQITVDVQWFPAHVGKEGNDLADSEAKHGSTLSQSPASPDYITASATLVTNQHAIATTSYDSDPHTRVHRVFTDVEPEYLPMWSILTVAGRVTGPEISASWWHSSAWAILHCWRPTCTASDVETQPLVHIAMVLTRRQNVWCYTAQHMTRHGGSHGQISTIKVIQDAYGASWRGLGRCPIPPTGNERERQR